MDEKEQDSWIYLADYIVLPYRKISNSGILGRAKLYHKKCIVSSAGGLKDQIEGEDLIYKTHHELAGILKEIDGNLLQ